MRRIIVTTEDTSRYKGVELASIAELRDRSQLLAAQQELAEVEGVTVLIHDQECAAEKRRARKRGKQVEPTERIWINERVCEGCGDCGEKSSCLSVQPVETEFGRKTQIHQASCNKDYSCLEGDCPSFLTVVPGKRARHETPPLTVELPEPSPARLRRRLRRAHDGHRRHRRRDREPGARHGGADRRPARVGPRPDRPLAEGRPGRLRPAHLARAARRGVARRPPARSTSTSASTCSARPPTRTSSPPRPTAPSRSSRRARCRPAAWSSTSTSASPSCRRSSTASTASRAASHNLYLDAQQLSERLFGDHMMTNTLALGAAYQRGLLPVSAGALEQAIRLNGAAVEKNLAAFAWGRAVVAAPDAVEQATRAARGAARTSSPTPSASWSRSRSTATPASCAGSSRCACPSWSPTRTRPTRAATPRRSGASTWPSRSARPATPS